MPGWQLLAGVLVVLSAVGGGSGDPRDVESTLTCEGRTARGESGTVDSSETERRRGVVLAATCVLHRALVAKRESYILGRNLPGIDPQSVCRGVFFEDMAPFSTLLQGHGALRVFARYEPQLGGRRTLGRARMRLEQNAGWEACVALPNVGLSCEEISASEQEKYVEEGYDVRRVTNKSADVWLEVGAGAFEYDGCGLRGMPGPGTSDTARVAFVMAAVLGPSEDALREEQGLRRLYPRWARPEFVRFARKLLGK